MTTPVPTIDDYVAFVNGVECAARNDASQDLVPLIDLAAKFAVEAHLFLEFDNTD